MHFKYLCIPRTSICKEDRSAPGFEASRDSNGLTWGRCRRPQMETLGDPAHESRRAFEHTAGVLREPREVVDGRPSPRRPPESPSSGVKYCLENHVPSKMLLIVGYAPGIVFFPPDDLHASVRVVILPSNTTSLIQAMGQGVIAALKATTGGDLGPDAC